MRILVLDDNPERHRVFRRNLIGHLVTHVETYHEALDALAKTPPFDLVFLDHDLNEFEARSVTLSSMYEGGGIELTGNDLCRYIAERLPKTQHPKTAVIHSLNHAGAKNMASHLKYTEIDVIVHPYRTDITVRSG